MKDACSGTSFKRLLISKIKAPVAGLQVTKAYCLWGDDGLLPPANEVSGKVMFLYLSVCSQGGLPTGVSLQGDCIWGVCQQWDLYPGGLHLGGLGTRKAGDTYPTGMLSCFCIIVHIPGPLMHLLWTVNQINPSNDVGSS